MTIIKIITGNGIVRPVHLKQIAWCNFFMSEFINSPKLGNGPLKSLIFFFLAGLTLVTSGESALPGKKSLLFSMRRGEFLEEEIR